VEPELAEAIPWNYSAPEILKSEEGTTAVDIFSFAGTEYSLLLL
jgi:hypothetical protein